MYLRAPRVSSTLLHKWLFLLHECKELPEKILLGLLPHNLMNFHVVYIYKDSNALIRGLLTLTIVIHHKPNTSYIGRVIIGIPFLYFLLLVHALTMLASSTSVCLQ